MLFGPYLLFMAIISAFDEFLTDIYPPASRNKLIRHIFGRNGQKFALFSPVFGIKMTIFAFICFCPEK